MTTPSEPDGSNGTTDPPDGGLPYLPPVRPVSPDPAATTPPLPPAPPGPPVSDAPPAPEAAAEAPFLPSAPRPQAPAPSAEPAFDAKAMVESQKHFVANPAYGAMPTGTDESRAAARKLREDANRKRRRNRRLLRVVALVVLAGVAVGGYFVYRAVQDDDASGDVEQVDQDGAGGADADQADGGALTPLGEQEQVIDALDDVNSGATASAGGLLDAVEEARDVVGQAQPPVAAPESLLVADLFTPAVLEHTELLDEVDGRERFVVRGADLEAADPPAHAVLLERLLALPQVAADDARLDVAPVVLPGDIAISIDRDGDTITSIVAVASDPVVRAVGP